MAPILLGSTHQKSFVVEKRNGGGEAFDEDAFVTKLNPAGSDLVGSSRSSGGSASGPST